MLAVNLERTARAALQRRLAKRGYRIERINERLDRQQLGFLMSAAGVTHVIDVGANTGQFARRVRSHGFRGRIDSFEPIDASFAQLTKTMRRDKAWFGHKLAASNQSRTAPMNVYPRSDLASLTSVTEAGTAVFGSYQDLTKARTEQVECAPLDDCSLPEVGPVFLKIDTQGHDWSVIAGARRLLDRVVMLSIELSFVGLYQEAVPAWKSLEDLAALGLHLAAIDTTVCPADDPLLIGEADGVFLRRSR